MPNKKVNDLKEKSQAAQDWQSALKIKDLTTREWDDAATMAAGGKSFEEIRKAIKRDRK